jgi:hypothetical protein
MRVTYGSDAARQTGSRQRVRHGNCCAADRRQSVLQRLRGKARRLCGAADLAAKRAGHGKPGGYAAWQTWRLCGVH